MVLNHFGESAIRRRPPVNAVDGLLHGLQAAITPTNLLWLIVGCLLGTLVGILPGLGPPATIAILLPLATGFDPATGLIMMAGIYYGAKYGGSTTSILLNIPGESSSVVTCIDGYEMAKQGRAGKALGIAAIASFVAGTIGVIGLTFLAPLAADVAVNFGPPEYSALMVVRAAAGDHAGRRLDAQGLHLDVHRAVPGHHRHRPVLRRAAVHRRPDRARGRHRVHRAERRHLRHRRGAGEHRGQDREETLQGTQQDS